jgi:hypothetical protein
MSPRFDTLAIARDLLNHGFTQDQAEAVATVVNQAAGLPDLSQLATKDELRTAIAEVRTDIADVKSDILKWNTGLILSAVTVNIAAMLALAKLLGH